MNATMEIMEGAKGWGWLIDAAGMIAHSKSYQHKTPMIAEAAGRKYAKQMGIEIMVVESEANEDESLTPIA